MSGPNSISFSSRLSVWLFAAAAMLSSTFASADIYRILDDSSQALQARVNLIQNAQQSIDLAYFIWSKDETGMQMLALLRAAAKRGVKVRIIVDSIFDQIPSETKLLLADEGIVIKDYNPFKLLAPSTWAHRMHNKLFLVDHQSLIMGGRNIEDAYYGLEKVKGNYRDRDVFIQGTAVAEAEEYYNELWDSPEAMIHIKKLKHTPAEADAALNEAMESFKDHPFLKLDQPANLAEGETQRSPVHFFHDAVGNRRSDQAIHDYLVEMVGQAQTSIAIESAYLVITNGMLQTFQNAIDRGVHVRILTNSLNSTDGLPAQAGYIGRKKNLVKMGVELWEYTGDRHLHIKSGVIDGKTALIGSYNLDPLSANRNKETVSYIQDEQMAQELLASMDENLESAVQINRHGKPVGSRTRFPGVPWAKIIQTELIRFLIMPIFKGQV